RVLELARERAQTAVRTVERLLAGARLGERLLARALERLEFAVPPLERHHPRPEHGRHESEKCDRAADPEPPGHPERRRHADLEWHARFAPRTDGAPTAHAHRVVARRKIGER